MPISIPGPGSDDRSLRRLQSCHVDDLLYFAVRVNGTDLNLAVGWPPVVRVGGKLFQAPFQAATVETLMPIVYEILTDQQIQELESGSEIDFTYAARRIANFRCKILREYSVDRSIAAAFHAINRY